MAVAWWSLTAKKGSLRLTPERRDPGRLWDQSSLLLQKFPAERFTATTELTLTSSTDGGRSGLVVMGRDYACLAIWVGARVGVFTAPVAAKDAGHTDVEWFRIGQ